MNGKGSAPRPTNMGAYRANWDATFNAPCPVGSKCQHTDTCRKVGVCIERESKVGHAA